MLSLWYLALAVSIAALLAGIIKMSWPYIFLSAMSSIPIAYYFSGAKNAWKYVGLTPVFLLILAILIWYIRKNFHKEKRI